MLPFDIPRLDPDPESPFPDPRRSVHPDGLVAVGGDLSIPRLVNAYRNGIFPWFEHPGQYMWWSPDPRAVMIPGHMHIGRRLRRTLRQGHFSIRLDTAFEAVVRACAKPRPGQRGTWITSDMMAAYAALYMAGIAHSVEVWYDNELIGGLYGVALGRVFFAESKFHRRRDASKIALAVAHRVLEAHDFTLMDCQIWNPHLERLGVDLLYRNEFVTLVDALVPRASIESNWRGTLAGVNLRDW